MASDQRPQHVVLPTAPPAPPDVKLGEGYISLRCQFCLCWSTEMCPVPKTSSLERWWPLMPWGAGSLQCPKGPNCLLCLNVHSGGGWEIETGSVKKTAVFFRSNPTRLHAFIKQRCTLILLRSQNPSCRIRDANQLGPRTTVSVEDDAKEELIAPLQWFVTLATYTQLLKPPEDSDITYKKFHGATIAGVVVAGNQWKLMWEDGQEGVYQLSSSQSTSVKRKHELVSNEDAQLVDGLVDKTLDHCRKTMLDNHAAKLNQPKFIKSSAALLSITADVDDALSVAGSDANTSVPGAPRRFADLSQACLDHGERVEDRGDDPPGLFDTLKGTKACAPVVESKKAKPKAKANPVPSAPAHKGRPGRDRDQGDDDGQAKKKLRLVESMQPPEAPRNASKTGSVADAVAEADKKWLTQATADVKAMMMLDPADESKIKAYLGDVAKQAAKLVTSIRHRKRTLKRRTAETAEIPMSDASNLEDQMVLFIDLVKLMQRQTTEDANAVGDSCYVKCTALLDHGATFAPSAVKHIARLMWMDDLRWKRWSSMHDVTFKFLQRTCPVDMDVQGFMGQSLNVMLQKLLKAIPAEQVTIVEQKVDQIETLVEFVDAMIGCPALASQDKEDFASLRDIIRATSTNPAKTNRAIKIVREHASADRKLLATFQAAGAKFLELADEFSGQKLKANQFIQTLDAIRVECIAHVESLTQPGAATVDDPKLSWLIDEGLKFSTKFIDACKQKSSDESQGGRDAAIADAREAVSNFVDVIVHRHFMLESLPWFSCAAGKMKESNVWGLLSPPAWDVLKLQKLCEASISEPTRKFIESTCGFYDCTAQFVKEMDKYKSATEAADGGERMRATHLCAQFTKWRNAHAELQRHAGDRFVTGTEDLKAGFDLELENIFFTSWQNLMDKPRQALIGIVNAVKVSGFIGFAKSLKDHPMPFEALINDCTDASFVLTGISSEHHSPLQLATDYMKYQLDACRLLALQKVEDDVEAAGKVIRSFYDVYDVVMGREENLGLDQMNLEISVSKWLPIVENMFKTIFQALPTGSEFTLDIFTCFFENQSKFLVVKLRKASEVCVGRLDDAMKNFKTFHPLPAFTPETEDSFFRTMMADQLYSKFNELAHELEDCVGLSAQIAADLGVSLDVFLPLNGEGLAARKTLLGLSTATTSLRILRSKAAENAAASMKPNVDGVIAFIDTHEVDIPKAILDRVKALHAKLESTMAKPAAGSKGSKGGA